MNPYLQSIAALLIALLLMGLAGRDDFEEALAHDSLCAENPNAVACRGKQ